MNVSLKTEFPATVQMLNPTRGNLFVVLTEKSHFVVQIGEILFGADDTIGSFQRGYVELDKTGEPKLLRLATQKLSSPCRALVCASPCPECAGVMRPAGEYFVCAECGTAL